MWTWRGKASWAAVVCCWLLPAAAQDVGPLGRAAYAERIEGDLQRARVLYEEARENGPAEERAAVEAALRRLAAGRVGGWPDAPPLQSAEAALLEQALAVQPGDPRRSELMVLLADSEGCRWGLERLARGEVLSLPPLAGGPGLVLPARPWAAARLLVDLRDDPSEQALGRLRRCQDPAVRALTARVLEPARHLTWLLELAEDPLLRVRAQAGLRLAESRLAAPPVPPVVDAARTGSRSALRWLATHAPERLPELIREPLVEPRELGIAARRALRADVSRSASLVAGFVESAQELPDQAERLADCLAQLSAEQLQRARSPLAAWLLDEESPPLAGTRGLRLLRPLAGPRLLARSSDWSLTRPLQRALVELSRAQTVTASGVLEAVRQFAARAPQPAPPGSREVLSTLLERPDQPPEAAAILAVISSLEAGERRQVLVDVLFAAGLADDLPPGEARELAWSVSWAYPDTAKAASKAILALRDEAALQRSLELLTATGAPPNALRNLWSGLAADLPGAAETALRQRLRDGPQPYLIALLADLPPAAGQRLASEAWDAHSATPALSGAQPAWLEALVGELLRQPGEGVLQLLLAHYQDLTPDQELQVWDRVMESGHEAPPEVLKLGLTAASQVVRERAYAALQSQVQNRAASLQAPLEKTVARLIGLLEAEQEAVAQGAVEALAAQPSATARQALERLATTSDRPALAKAARAALKESAR